MNLGQMKCTFNVGKRWEIKIKALGSKYLER